MKFTKKERQIIKIDWKEGAVIHVKRAFLQDTMSSKINNDPQAMGMLFFEKSIVDWNGIEDEDKKEIPFSEKMRSEIFEEIIKDADMIEKLSIALNGALGNLNAGSTVQSTGNGDGAIASTVSKKTEN